MSLEETWKIFIIFINHIIYLIKNIDYLYFILKNCISIITRVCAMGHLHTHIHTHQTRLLCAI
jgi:hypothetical protein